MNNILQQIVKDINEEKVKSVQPQALTKRGGEYRIGLSKAIDIVEEYAAQFAAPPPSSEGEMTDAETVIFFELKNKKYVTKSGFEITTDMLMKAEHFISDDVCYIKVPLATLPTREQRGEKEKFAIRFSEWLMIQCEYKNHCVWEYRGEEYTQNELIEIFKRTTPLPSPPKH